ncbi:hypothetical protein ACIA5D_36620 [Actinoplanes sp. NPDC051513]|uniref:hypothetical protein n=1 Tax=Actinoplanes sp. NPDC051513 TaxID=3363908 RepID=UPI0037ADF98E
MTAHRYVDPWTPLLDLQVGDRAINRGGQAMEWNGHRGIPVCGGCDLAMHQITDDGSFCCPGCHVTTGEALPVFGSACDEVAS